MALAGGARKQWVSRAGGAKKAPPRVGQQPAEGGFARNYPTQLVSVSSVSGRCNSRSAPLGEIGGSDWRNKSSVATGKRNLVARSVVDTLRELIAIPSVNPRLATACDGTPGEDRL